MASNSISTINKLKSFAVSPCSSQDFEVSSQNSETVSTPENHNLLDFDNNEEYSRKRKLNEPVTSTQCLKERNINENNQNYEKSNLPLSEFQSNESPIKVSSNSSVGSASFELIDSPSPGKCLKTHNKQQSDRLTFEENLKDIPRSFIQTKDTGPDTVIERQEIQPFNDEIQYFNDGPPILDTNSSVDLIRKEPEIDADMVVELATQTFSGVNYYNENGPEIHTEDRQFPGPAGILPRLHKGLDSNPNLINLMRTRKGKDLKKFSAVPTKDCSTSKDGTKNNRETLGKTEFIDNNHLWQRMLNDDKLASEGYHELMTKFNIKFIKDSSEKSFSCDLDIAKSYLSYITKTPLLIGVVKWIDLITGHQDPTCQLIDNTGTIYGQLSSEIIEQYGARIQPGTVLVLRNMAILSTSRNIYVNITLTNMIALYWIRTSRENGLRTTPNIFGKRICRVTKDDILKDAKLMEEEAKAEAHAHQASYRSENATNNSHYNVHPVSPTSSSSSVPSSIKNPINNNPNNVYNNRNNVSRSSISPVHPGYNPNNLTNSSMQKEYLPSNFRTPSLNWRPDNCNSHRVSPYNQLNPINTNDRNNMVTNTTAGPARQSSPSPSMNSRNILASKFQFNPNSRSSPIRQDSFSSARKGLGSPVSDDSVLLEGLDEDSLFGDF